MLNQVPRFVPSQKLALKIHHELNQILLNTSQKLSLKLKKNLQQVADTYILHMTIGLPLVGVLLASLLLNRDAMVYLEKKYKNCIT